MTLQTNLLDGLNRLGLDAEPRYDAVHVHFGNRAPAIQDFFRQQGQAVLRLSEQPETHDIRLQADSREETDHLLNLMEKALYHTCAGTLPEKEPAVQQILKAGEAIHNEQMPVSRRRTHIHEAVEELQAIAEHPRTPLTAQLLAETFLPGLMQHTRASEDGTNLYESSAQINAFHTLCEQTPFIRFGYQTANLSILDAAPEPALHIVDLGIGKGTQWPGFFQQARDAGIKRLHLTGIDLPADSPDAVQNLHERLMHAAHEAGFNDFQYRHIAKSFTNLIPTDLTHPDDMPTAINAILAMHHLPCNEKHRLLTMIQEAQPFIHTTVEAESNHEHGHFQVRLREAITHYGSVFDALSNLLDDREKARALAHTFFQPEIINVLRLKDSDRFERHMTTRQWRGAMHQAGMHPRSLPDVSGRVCQHLNTENPHLQYRQENDHFKLTWKEIPLLTATCWQAA